MLSDINLFEGGNVFKDSEGRLLTTRIARENVVPTVQWLEQLTGLNLVDNMLGSTGRNETSGDLDIGVDSSKITKEVLIQQLERRGVDRNDIRKTGDSVHLKTPILGDPANGYVQTDFMFGHPEWQQFRYMGGGAGQFKGMHRAILLSSIAKELGYIFSNKDGLLNRNTREVITTDPAEAAKILIGGTVEDTRTVDSIIKKIKNHPKYEQLVADAREAFARENLVLPEERTLPGTGAWYRQFINQRI